MSTPRCFIRSSINIDQYFSVENVVRPGETISSQSLTERIGGKGANTAVAIAKAGASVQFSGLIDHQSTWLKKSLSDFGVNVDGLRICDEKSKLLTGRAIIQVSRLTGENAIVLVPGTNHASSEFWPDLEPILTSGNYSHVLLQNEIPIVQTVLTSKLAHSLGITTIFNPSPLPSHLEVIESIDWGCIDWLIVNEEEVRILRDRASSRISTPCHLECDQLPGLEQDLEVMQDLINLSMAKFAIVITLGSRGSLLACKNSTSVNWTGIYTPASSGKRAVIDTTGAGDCFTGFLVAELMRLEPKLLSQDSLEGELKKALRVASQAARLCVENHGTIDSYPSLEEVHSHII